MKRIESGFWRLPVMLGMALAACNDEVATGIPELGGKPTFAVHRADYDAASAIALIDGNGKLMKDSYLSSGTEVPGLNAALAADIALPTQPCEETTLTVLGRRGSDYILQVDLESAEVVHQFRTQTTEEATAFSSNPQDILCLDDGRVVISRFGVNLSADSDDLNRGDDLVIVDVKEEELSSRIDLSEFEGATTAVDENGDEQEVHTWANPSRLVRLGDFALVGLARLSDSFQANAEGTVLLLSLDDFEVKPVALEGLANCGAVVPVAGRDDAAIVRCEGGPVYGDPASSGLAFVTVRDGEATVEHIFQVEAGEKAIYANPVSLGGTRLISVADGYTDDSAPEAYVLDLESGESELLFKGKTPGAIGSGAYRKDTGLLLIPDADVGVRVFHEEDGAFEEQDAIELDGSIPARSIRPLVKL